jgi:hypothetical protein
MKAIPPRFKTLLRQLRELRAELRELKANPPKHADPLEAFCTAMRPPLEDEPEPPPPKRIAAGHGRGEAGELKKRW